MPEEINYQWLHDIHEEIKRYAEDVRKDIYDLADKSDIDRDYTLAYFIKQIRNNGDKNEIF